MKGELAVASMSGWEWKVGMVAELTQRSGSRLDRKESRAWEGALKTSVGLSVHLCSYPHFIDEGQKAVSDRARTKMEVCLTSNLCLPQ